MPWDVRHYRDNISTKNEGMNEEFEESLKRRYPPINGYGKITEPCVVIDNEGIILVWYIPNILTVERQVWEFRCK